MLLVGLTLGAYWSALRGGFIWDDDSHLTANPCIVGRLGFSAIWTTSSGYYYPLVLTIFWIEHAIWGLNPLFFHLVNVLVHAVNALLLWRVLLSLRVAGAWLGAALWALHPVQVESVAWITELKNTQSCFFYLLAILFFIRWRVLVGASKNGSKISDYVLAISFSVLAMLSKTSTVMLPIVLCLCWWWIEGRWRWRNLIWVSPLFLVSIAGSVWTIWEQKVHSLAHGQEWPQNALQRFAIAGKAIWFYFGKLLWPDPLIFIYPRWQIDTGRPISFLPVAAVVLVAVALWLGLRRYRPQTRPLFFAFSYFCISLFPVMGFFNLYFFRYTFVADHFQYLAAMSPLALVGAGLWHAGERVGDRKRFITFGVASLVLAGLCALTWRHTFVFKNIAILWEDTLAKNPNAYIAHVNLGFELARQGKLPEAIEQYQSALQLKPDALEAINLQGVALDAQGKLPEAIQQYERAIQLQPNFAEAYNNLGFALANQGKIPEAIQKYERALQLKPDYPGVYNNLGSALGRQGRLADAIQNFERALRLNADYAEAYNNLGLALALQGKLPEAIEQCQQAVRLKPDYAEGYNNLGFAMASEGKLAEAIQHYEKALQFKPAYVEALNNLAHLLATSQDLSLRNGVKAVGLSEKANRLTDEKNPVILGTLAAAYAEAGRDREAVETVTRAIKLAGDQGNSGLVNILEAQAAVYQGRVQ